VHRPTEYAVMKRLLFAWAEFDPELSLTEANGMIQDACVSAYDKLEHIEQRHVKRASQTLQDECHSLGEKGALVLLAAMAPYMSQDYRIESEE